MGAAKKILGMEILRDRQVGKLYLSQKRYIEKVLHKFNIQNVKPFNTPLAYHFRLSFALSPQSDDDVYYMARVTIPMQWDLSFMSWFVPVQIYHTPIALLTDIWKISVNNIGRQYNGYSGSYMDPLMFVWDLGRQEMV